MSKWYHFISIIYLLWHFFQKFTQWTFWYCNDIGVTSPSISVWHCWYIINETHDDVNLRYQLDIRSWDWTDQTLMPSWHPRDNVTSSLSGRKISSRIVYLFSITHNNATFILWVLKNQSFRRLFFSCCSEKYVVVFFKTVLLNLKVISNIVSESINWVRRTKMSPN